MSLVGRVKSGLELLSTVAVIVVAGVLVRAELTRPRAATTPVSASQEKLNDVHIDASTIRHRLGTSKTILIEFADFQCPYCARHANDTMPRVKQELIETGKLSYAYFHFPLQQIHNRAFGASIAAECAGQQNKYWEMHERLYANQSRMSTADVADYAKAIELDVDRFSTCLAGDVSKVVKADIEKGNTLGVTGTPVLFIGTLGDDGQVRLTTRFSGTATFDTLKRVVDQTAPRQEGWLARWLE